MGHSDGPPPGWMDDPTGVFTQRYWDGVTYTDCVLSQHGIVERDMASGSDLAVSKSASLPPPVPATVKHSPPPRPARRHVGTPGVAASRAITASVPAPKRHTGDAVLDFVSKVTLQSWLSDRMSKALWIPELTEIVRQHPRDPRPLMWLGLRLQDFERIRSRASRSTMPVTVAGAVLRPIVRPAVRAATKALSSSDGTPASKKVLGRAWQLLEEVVSTHPQDPGLVSLMARNYLSAGEVTKAWKVAATASRLQPERGEPYYILAEAAFDGGELARAQELASQALQRGCTLALALCRPDTPFRRQALHSTKRSAAIPTVEDHWHSFAAYYQDVRENEIMYFFGPQPVFGGVN